jgi:hypothetical protein
VPDVAGDASPATGYRVIVGGRAYVFGGTSAVAPLWAALTVLLVAKLGRLIGNFNAVMYTLLGTNAFRDITSGNNGGYSAGQGWDACTGLGSPNGKALLAALQPAQPPSDPGPLPPPVSGGCRLGAQTLIAAEMWAVVNAYDAMSRADKIKHYEAVVYAFDCLSELYGEAGNLPA